MTDLEILTAFTFCAGALTPFYLYMRVKIQRTAVDKDKPIDFYTMTRVLKLIVINQALTISGVIVFALLFMSVKGENNIYVWSDAELFIGLLTVLVLVMVGYGSGQYITSIIAEEYTLNRVKKSSGYEILDLTTELFHGPISHVTIFSGGFLALLLMAMLEMVGDGRVERVFSYAGMGVALGFVFTAAQIGNNTWKHQLPWVTGIYFGYLIIIAIARAPIEYLPFNVFFLFFGITVVVGLGIKLLLYVLGHGKYRYKMFDI